MAVTTNTHLPKSKKTKKPTVKKTKVKPAKLDVGRPVKYSDEFIRKEADALLVWIADKKSYYIGTFAAERGYNRARLVEFANNNDYFWCRLTNNFNPKNLRFIPTRLLG